jgi:hypothetical protein
VRSVRFCVGLQRVPHEDAHLVFCLLLVYVSVCMSVCVWGGG